MPQGQWCFDQRIGIIRLTQTAIRIFACDVASISLGVKTSLHLKLKSSLRGSSSRSARPKICKKRGVVW
jgi:hypothetical protein